MNNKKLGLYLIPIFIFSTNVLASALIETKREDSQDIMYVDGHRLLITGIGQDARMIMDFQKRKVYMVNAKNKSAMDMSEATWKALKEAGDQKPPPKVDAQLEIVGDGPEIAGYATTHYVIYVDGHKCAEKWTSQRALKDSGFDGIWDEYGDFLVSASIDADSHPCELAEYQVFRDDKHGVALKEIDHNCETDEILRIENDVDIDRSLFEIPSDYKIVKMPTYSGSIPQGNLQEDGTWSWGAWEGVDCSGERGGYSGIYDEGMDEEYADDEYFDEEYADEEYDEEEYDEEEAEDLENQMKSKLKGFMNKFKKKDKD